MKQDLLEHLVSDALEGILITDLEGIVLESNRTAQEILQYTELELRGQFVSIVFPSKSVTHLLPNLLKIARTREGFNGEMVLLGQGSSSVHVRLVAGPYPQEKPDVLIFRFLDWREVKALLLQLKETSQLAVLGAMTRAMAHEILNPVTVIGAYTRKLGESLPKEGSESEWVRHVLSAVKSLESLVSTVDHFNSLPPPSFLQGSLEEPLESALARSAPYLERMGINVRRRTKGVLPPIHLDPSLMEEALTAVIVNAGERMPNGGVLEITSAPSGGWASVLVVDSGPRLNPDRLEEDMSPMHVLHSFTANLNLAVARRIVEEHGGTMDLSSSGDVGLLIEICLPPDRRRVDRTRPA